MGVGNKKIAFEQTHNRLELNPKKNFLPIPGSDCRNKLLFSKCTASIRLLTQIHPSQAELNQTNRKRKLHVSS